MTVRTAILVFAGLALAACQPTDDSSFDPDTLSMDELAISVDSSIDQVNADAEGDESDDVLMDLEVDEADLAADRPTRRERVRHLIKRLAEDEPCALRGVLAGRYHRFETEAEADGAVRGRAFRRNEGLIARGQGTYQSFDGPGGDWAATWENFEGDTGTADGTYSRESVFEDIRLGGFEGQWASDDGPGFGNVEGLWHPTRDGRGLFVGYWSNCAMTPVHDANGDEV